MARTKKQSEILVRNFIFGVEDSLVSTVGLLSGIAVAGVARKDILLTGIVLVFVEAFSMGVGSFLSEDTAEELVTKKVKTGPLNGAITMFISYMVAGMIPIIPYVSLGVESAFVISILLSLVSLFILGALSAMLYKKPITRIGLRMLVMGGFAIVIGIAVGRVLSMH